MKKFFFVLLAMTSVILISSCEKDGGDVSDSTFVGKWDVTYMHYYPVVDGSEVDPHDECDEWYPGLYEDDCEGITLDIRKDGTVTAINKYPGGMVLMDKGTWIIVGDEYITFDMEGDYGDWWIEGEESFTVKKVSRKEIHLIQIGRSYHYDNWILEYHLKRK